MTSTASSRTDLAVVVAVVAADMDSALRTAFRTAAGRDSVGRDSLHAGKGICMRAEIVVEAVVVDYDSKPLGERKNGRDAFGPAAGVRSNTEAERECTLEAGLDVYSFAVAAAEDVVVASQDKAHQRPGHRQQPHC